MFCDLLIARFGMIQQEKEMDGGLAEAVSSLIWVAPRLQSDCQELKVIADLFTHKYGKQYALAARDNAVGTVSPKLMAKLSVQAPPKMLVENYMIGQCPPSVTQLWSYFSFFVGNRNREAVQRTLRA